MSRLVRGLSSRLFAWRIPGALPEWPALFGYGVAVISVACAFAATIWSRDVFTHSPFLFYYVPVVLSAWLGGLWPGLLATFLSAGVTDYLLVAGPRVLTADDGMQIAFFVVAGIVTAAMSASLRRTGKRLELKWRQEAVISEGGRRALVEDDLQRFLDSITRSVAETLGVEYCKVLRLVPEQDHFLLVSGTGWKPGTVGKATVEACGQMQAGYTLAVNTAVVLEDVRKETRFTAPALLTEHGVVSGLSVPIAGDDGPYGVLGAHAKAPHAFSQDDIHFIQSVGNLLAVSIQRQKSARQTAESEARYRALVELIPQMVWSATAAGEVDYVSPSWCRFTGLTPQESLGRDGWKRVLHSEDALRVLALWNASISRGTPYEVECRLRTANGTYNWILARAIAWRDQDGAVKKWFGTCTDIQGQRQAEEELRKTEKLAAIARLASAMAHEINNPLAAVTNLLYLLDCQTEDAHPVLRTYVQAAERELARVTHISNQVLGLYRESSEPAPVGVAEIIDRVIDLYGIRIGEKKVTIRKQYYWKQGVLGKRGELHHLFSNLLVNALEAVREGGSITVRIRARRDPKKREGKGVQVTFADNGRGILSEDQQRIFEPFFTTKSVGGAGLGLWIAANIVHQYNGEIRVRSRAARPNQSGTVISVYLPDAVLCATDPVIPAELRFRRVSPSSTSDEKREEYGLSSWPQSS